MPEGDPTELIDDIRAAVQNGDYFHAYDCARVEIDRGSHDGRLYHLALLALANSGALHQAQCWLDELKREGWLNRPMADGLTRDMAAFEARLHKDMASESTGGIRKTLAAKSAALYEAEWATRPDYYPAVNAATMWLMAGDSQRAETMAGHSLRLIDELDPKTQRTYWDLATQAEALLVLGCIEAAGHVLAEAMRVAGKDLNATARTRRQLGLICDLKGIPRASIEVARLPIVLHYGGHMLNPGDADGPFPAAREEAMRAKIAAWFDSRSVAWAFGSLACGSEILIAEEAVARGAEVKFILPCGPEEFRTRFVDWAAGWGQRFDRLVAERGVSVHGQDAYYGELSSLNASRCAMGMAIIRAENLLLPVEQLLVWNGAAPVGAAGTASDAMTWRGTGHAQSVIEADRRPASAQSAPGGTKRALRAFLFCDVRGFSTVDESWLPVFVREVLGGWATEMNPFSKFIVYRETAGDGLYLVFDDVGPAADCGLALLDRMDAVRQSALPQLALRVSAHVGVAYEMQDPVTGFTKFFGAEVIRAARIEPVTPPGQCYVTEEFASHLALAAPNRFICEYKGNLESAKGYGKFRMYSLRRLGSTR
jgi:class 3 adenylate cyclase